MFISILWAMPTHDGHKMRHMYQCGDYSVTPFTDDQSTGPNGPAVYTQLILDGGKHDIRLGGGDKAFIMNDDGKTIDIVQN